jgi:hypothetical protein
MTEKELGKSDLSSGIEIEEDSGDQFYAMFIEMILGPEHVDKNLDELTDEQKLQIVQAIAQIGGEFQE